MHHKRPIFGILSLGLLLLGICIEIAWALHSPKSLLNPIADNTIFYILGTYALGSIAGIIGLSRRENLKRLPLIGMILNLLVLVLHVAA